MRIAFITPEYVTEPSFGGGLANYLGRVTEALAGGGHDVHVFVRSRTDEQFDYRGVTLHRVVPRYDRRMVLDHVDPLVPRSLYSTYQDLKAAWCLWRRWMRVSSRHPFDLVQIPNVQSVGLFLRCSRHTPIVMRWSSYRPLWDTSMGVASSAVIRARWRIEALAAGAAQYHYAPSRYLARQIEVNLRIRDVSVVETPFFNEQKNSDHSVYRQYCAGKRYALFFGRMTQMKGVHVLANALRSVLEQCPDLHVVFVGRDASFANGHSMASYVRDQSSGFTDRVLLLDELRHEQLYPIIQGARLVVLPSIVDNLPNTCLEAMGLARAVVATTGSCFEQLISNGDSGLLVPPANAECLATTIVAAWKLDDETLEKMGQRARQRIDQLHPNVTIPQLVTYYESVVGERVAGRWQ